MIAIVGLLSACVGIILFFQAVKRSGPSQCVLAKTLILGEQVDFTSLGLKLSGICQYALHLSLSGTKTSVKSTESDYLEKQLLYCLPFDLKVFNAEGELLQHWKEAADCNRAHSTFVEVSDVDHGGGQLILEHGFEPFELKAPEVDRIEATLSKDQDYLAQLNAAELRIYSNIKRNMPMMLYATIFLLFGVIMLALEGLRMIGQNL